MLVRQAGVGTVAFLYLISARGEITQVRGDLRTLVLLWFSSTILSALRSRSSSLGVNLQSVRACGHLMSLTYNRNHINVILSARYLLFIRGSLSHDRHTNEHYICCDERSRNSLLYVTEVDIYIYIYIYRV